MSASRYEGDLVVTGTLKVGSIDLPFNSIDNSHVDSAIPIAIEKLEHAYSLTYAQNDTADVAAESRTIHFAAKAGSLISIAVGLITANTGNATVTVDLHKNGSSILSAPIVLDTDNTAYASEEGAFSSASYVSGDVFEVVVTVNAGSGTLGNGLFVNLTVREASPV